MHRNSAAEHDCHSHAHTHADPDHAHDHAHHDSAGGHHHAGLPEIEHIVSHLKIPEAVQRDVLAVYRLIAEAESAAHDKPVTEVHFHEVGAMDAVADVTAVCMLLHELAPERIAASISTSNPTLETVFLEKAWRGFTVRVPAIRSLMACSV